jgi:glycosyltransferase involved in cell wall biosynthesis
MHDCGVHEPTSTTNGARACRLSQHSDASAPPVSVLFYLFFPGSGIGRYTHELLQEMSQFPDLSLELACLPQFHWRHEARYPVWPGLREIAHARRWRRRLRFLIAQVENPRRLLRRAHDTNADIVHLSNINHLTFPIWRRWLRGGRPKVVATVHDVRRQRGIVNLRYEERQLRRFYEQADALFVHSRSQIDDLAEFADIDRDRVHIVPHGPYHYGPASASRSVLRSRLGLPQDKKVALFFGNIRDEKRLDLLLQALPCHAGSLHLLVAGSADVPGHKGYAWYRDLSRSLSVENAITFLEGYVHDPSIPDLFVACDWVAMPYSRTFTSQSGVLNVAMSYHRPVLATTAPTLEETLAKMHVGVLVAPDSADALTRGIDILHDQLDRREEYSFEEYLTRYSWTETVRRTLTVYRSLTR